jgi:pimeloyl-ACP methyl ester carboxylesterase
MLVPLRLVSVAMLPGFVRVSPRRTGAGIASCVAIALGAGIAAAPAEAGLSFSPCQNEGSEGWECASLRVPLDRSGRVPGTVRLHVERFRAPGTAPQGTLVNVEGGPGGSASSRAAQTRRLFAPLLDRYQLVTVDARGVPRSQPVFRCREPGSAACGRKYGRRARFYRTADNVADIDSVRAALGVDKIFVYGTSYGTLVASQYARTHPDHTERIALDSPIRLSGIAEIASYARVTPRIAREICQGGQCAGVTSTPVGDIRDLSRRLNRRSREIRVYPRDGGVSSKTADADTLLDVLIQSDENVSTQAFYPGAIKAALRGDFAPLARLSVLAPIPFSPAVINPAITPATNCADYRMPWGNAQNPRVRRRALRRLARSVPRSMFGPFPRSVAWTILLAPECIDWPISGVPGALTNRPPSAQVPVLVLAGTRDLRTPLSDGESIVREWPGAQLMPVPNVGHGVLRNAVTCGQEALERFVAGTPVGDPCARTPVPLGVQPIPPKNLSAVRPASGVPGKRGRVVAAALATIEDAYAVAHASTPQGGRVVMSGLRGGRLRGNRDASTNTARLNARNLTYIPRVVVSGDVSGGPKSWTGRLRIAGAATGTLTVGADGRVTGRINGQPVSTTR